MMSVSAESNQSTLDVYSNNATLLGQGVSESDAKYQSLIKSMELVGIPIIVAVGLVGNILSAFVFLGKNLRKLSCSLYLAARAVSDCLFLICLLIVWFQHVQIRIFHTVGVCQIEIFLSYLSGYLSVWFIVFATVENYYRVCRPFNIRAFCTVEKARLITLTTILIGCFVYSFSTWTNGIVTIGETAHCSLFGQYVTINTVLTYVDCLITLFVPSVIIVSVTVIITYTVTSCNMKDRTSGRSGSKRLTANVSRMLFCVSVVFICLNLPSHLVRLYVLIELLMEHAMVLSTGMYFAQRILQMVYYLSFAINFFIYVIFGPSFRKNCLEAVGKPFTRNVSMRTDVDTKSSGLLVDTTEGLREKFCSREEATDR